ncbi:alpha-D-ribose 1-methylphosphonate 5-triphosphate diphosphatase [Roseomonas alkaliterrae]|uniref:Alpha-D-ribose 1-methylphosphonate 5-triphosphate diphosphatase n=1 Tax=Neoroseomonas alkaliterrae TaxID=1452450 RepID=A0A840XMY9_9PROT|nr:alpha-D-ribose 1-methylphosphonate 5-triphosphate diphosphatase [Neoroseomonas alkaliterrae]MBB5689948.1 alpha-D-ribose 1-methylphosphonate 5-triphosphate diphosphatase [Neoroseomonas alkaliterrae]MBR0675461.1 alpha-D-ribose 1-methylphosphonate 5-triphosphate diphosphatase [Neoroseomonas alkaliterrae]
MTAETILTNAILVLPEETLPGTLVIRSGRIAETQPGRSHAASARDLEGDYLIPGVVDVHTDNLERQVQPRQNARWPSRSAMIAHDAQCAAAGVTTVLDALCLGDLGFDQGRGQTFLDGVADLDALADTGVLRSEHFLHLRCELPAADMKPAMDPVADHPRVRMVSLMDHSPGVGQYRDIERYVAMRRKQTQMTVEQVQDRIASLLDQRARLREPQRAWLLDRIRHRDLPIASHDDETAEDVRRNLADGIRISEFPVTMVAAEAARDAGVEVIAGAPNIVRGGSHSGNVAAADLVRAKAADAFASDYVPASMVEAAWRAVEEAGITLPQAVAMITDRPARMCRLDDRGRLAPGLRADLAQIRTVEDIPVVRRVWREGSRVA